MITLAYSWVLNLLSWVPLCYFLGTEFILFGVKKHLLYYIFYFFELSAHLHHNHNHL